MMSSSKSKVRDEHDFRDQTVPQLIPHIKSAIDSEFKNVESLLENLLNRELEVQMDRNKLAVELVAILLLREEKLKHEIESKRNENESIKQENERERLEKAAEMEKWENEVLELREKNTLTEGVEQQNSVLKSQMDCLESAKKKAEMEITVLKKRVLDLEKGIPLADNVAFAETCIISYVQIHNLESAKEEADTEVAVLKRSVRDLENKLSELVKRSSMLTNTGVLNAANEEPISMIWEELLKPAFYIVTKSQVSSLESATKKAKMEATLLTTRVLDLEKGISKFEEVRMCDSKGLGNCIWKCKGKRKRRSKGSGNAFSKAFGKSSTKAAGKEDEFDQKKKRKRETQSKREKEKGVSEKLNKEIPKHCDPTGKSKTTKITALDKLTTPAKRTKLTSSEPSCKAGNGSDSHQGIPKEKSTTTKKSFLSKEKTRKTVAKGKEKAKRDNLPYYKDLKDAICDILKRVDVYTTKFNDIMKQLAMKFQMDLSGKKALIRRMIDVEVHKIAEAEVEGEKDIARIIYG